MQRPTPTLMTAFILIGVTLLTTGCTTLPNKSDKKPQEIKVQLIASPTVNPDLEGIPSPLRLDILELKEIGEFNAANYQDLINDDKALGDKLVRKTQYMIHPDSVTFIPLEVTKTGKYLGVIGSYLNIENSNWKLSLLKQEPAGFNNSENYLYLYVDKQGIQQLAKPQMTTLLKDYAKRHPEDKRVKKNGKLLEPKADYSKGIYTQKLL